MKVRTAMGVILWMLHMLILVLKVSSTGVFELHLTQFRNANGLNADGNCCNGIRTGGKCSSTCRTFFRICLSHYQAKISEDPICTFASLTSPVLGENDLEFQDIPSIDFENPIQFPITFSWPGTFSLIIETWHDTTLTGPSQGSPRELISRLAVQRSVEVGEQWSNFIHKSKYSNLTYSYRMVCDENYYGPSCSILCQPREDQFGHYTCTSNGTKVCLDGWTGNYCDQAQCSPGCHPDNGFCDFPHSCNCRVGYQGTFCDECIKYPGCQHGTCKQPFDCNCEEGWGGLFCNQDLNYCTHYSPCLNGATCMNTGEGSYTCSCPPGFEGTNCEVETDDCQHQPCLNGGKCEDVGSAYQCKCPSGYSGRRCDTLAQSCQNSPCQHQATCVEGEGTYQCICKPGYTGLNCEADVNECTTDPCKNGGRCVDEQNGFRCVCSTGYSGPTCEVNDNDCSHQPCQNGGKCEDLVNDFKCRCVAGFVGPLCEKNVDECKLYPCANGGSCHDLINDFSCDCALGFTGKDCSVKEHEVNCADTPCQNGGKCTDLNNDYKCLCENGFHGKNCQYTLELPANVTTTQKPTEKPHTPSNITTTLPNNGSVAVMQNMGEEEEGGSGLTMMQLVLIVCLGAGIPLVIIIIVIIVLLLHKKHSFPHNSMQKEKEQNVVNNMNNKVVDSNIFTTIPASNVKMTNEEQDFTSVNTNKSRHSRLYLDKPSNRHFTKECNINPYNKREQLQISQNDLPQKSHKNIDLGTYSTDSYSVGNSSLNLDIRTPDIQIIEKPINQDVGHQTLHIPLYGGGDYFATEV
ncbi:hypothetical protein ScPMuIL_014514 [Solemya velum]